MHCIFQVFPENIYFIQINKCITYTGFVEYGGEELLRDEEELQVGAQKLEYKIRPFFSQLMFPFNTRKMENYPPQY